MAQNIFKHIPFFLPLFLLFLLPLLFFYTKVAILVILGLDAPTDGVSCVCGCRGSSWGFSLVTCETSENHLYLSIMVVVGGFRCQQIPVYKRHGSWIRFSLVRVWNHIICSLCGVRMPSIFVYLSDFIFSFCSGLFNCKIERSVSFEFISLFFFDVDLCKVVLGFDWW